MMESATARRRLYRTPITGIVTSPLVAAHVAVLLLSFLVCLCSASFPSQPAARLIARRRVGTNSTDLRALLAFKSSLGSGPSESLASWNESSSLHFCRWRGVVCGGRRHPERVMGLGLRSLGLSGAIPTSVANLTFLRRLDLSDNSFYGHIPWELAHLFRLRHLNLSFNSLTGGIPAASLVHFPDLRTIQVRANRLVGVIPVELASLQKLVLVDLSQNRFAGPIPPPLGNLSSLSRLYLADNGLTGPIPETLTALSSLQALDLSGNHLEGPIPPALGTLQSLWFLDMTNNSLTGTIPPSVMRNLSSLQFMYLSQNRLRGSIPTSSGSLASLAALDVSRNELTGSIPPWLGNLTSLNALAFTDNSLSGAIPPSLGDLISLTFFTAAENQLTGTVPPSIYNLSSLITLDLGGNQLSGTLPSDIGISLPNLQILSMRDNQFHGSIPSSIPNASALHEIQLYNNKFSGTVPSRLGTLQGLTWLLLFSNQLQARDADDWSFLTSLANCTHLDYLSLTDNKFEGVLPPAISNLSTTLRRLQLDGNRISGSVPEGIGNLHGLTALALGSNLFRGAIPTAIGKLQKLIVLDLSRNQFLGQIPSSLSNLTQLNRLSMRQNELRGAIPPSFGELRNLLELHLSFNKLSGAIPKGLVNLTSLSIALVLSHNSLTGVLPPEVGHLRNLHLLDVSENKLSGQLPITLGNCELLGVLLMQGNDFQGEVPRSFSKLSGLEALDLSRNNLSGKIPDFLENFRSLRYLNFSYNNLEGEVPKGGIFQNASAVSLSGNHKLCGGISELHLQACSVGKSGEDHGHAQLKAIIITVSCASLCLLVLILCLIPSRYLRRKGTPPVASSNESLVRFITYSELFRATDGFSSQNLLGVGSFGSVYKASMDPTEPNGRYVAVKVINLEQQGAARSFMAECGALRNVRHRNLLKILTSCSSIDHHGNDFKALVFQFMPNGSLEQWLHPAAGNHENVTEKRLGLLERLNVAVDVASALAYLHHHSHEPIVHCDLKPSNVLLDDDMTAHVGDFGLARFLGSKDDNGSLASSLALKGSIGYVAPEYGMGCKASPEGDVFSYGVLLLEMVTGRRPTDASFMGDLTLHKFVEMVFPEHVLDIVDPTLLVEDDQNAQDVAESMNNLRQCRQMCLVSTARLGLLCSKESPKERMGMEAVTREMTTIRENFLRVGDKRDGYHKRGNIASASRPHGSH